VQGGKTCSVILDAAGPRMRGERRGRKRVELKRERGNHIRPERIFKLTKEKGSRGRTSGKKNRTPVKRHPLCIKRPLTLFQRCPGSRGFGESKTQRGGGKTIYISELSMRNSSQAPMKIGKGREKVSEKTGRKEDVITLRPERTAEDSFIGTIVGKAQWPLSISGGMRTLRKGQ